MLHVIPYEQKICGFIGSFVVIASKFIFSSLRTINPALTKIFDLTIVY